MGSDSSAADNATRSNDRDRCGGRAIFTKHAALRYGTATTQSCCRYLEQAVSLDDYAGELRQIAVTGLEREAATFFLTNNFEASPRDVIMNYARRNRIEGGCHGARKTISVSTSIRGIGRSTLPGSVTGVSVYHVIPA